MTPQIVLFLQIFLLTTVIGERCNKNPIKYEVEQYFKFKEKITEMEEDVISSLPSTVRISIESDIPKICKGLLQINESMSNLFIDDVNLESIEPGAFDNQNVTSQIRFYKNKLTLLKAGSFKDLPVKHLDFSQNPIATIEEGAFENLPNLLGVLFSRNKIATFNQNFFVNTPMMGYIRIDWNQLKEIGPGCFSFMSKYEKASIRLGTNQIKVIHPSAFEGIKLQTLYLAENQLREIPEEIFTKNEVRNLNLENNEIVVLPEAFYGYKNFESVNLKGNPLDCDVQKKLDGLAKDTKERISYNKTEC